MTSIMLIVNLDFAYALVYSKTINPIIFPLSLIVNDDVQLVELAADWAEMIEKPVILIAKVIEQIPWPEYI